jgi:Tfp pilus assembly protein PilO
MSNAAIFVVLIASMVGLVAALMLLLGYFGIHQSKQHEIHLLRHRDHLLRTGGRHEADRAAR